MRIILPFLLISGIVTVLLVMLFLGKRQFDGEFEPDRAAADRSDEEARVLGTRMARLLERGVNDPVARLHDDWQDEAMQLVKEWYRD